MEVSLWLLLSGQKWRDGEASMDCGPREIREVAEAVHARTYTRQDSEWISVDISWADLRNETNRAAEDEIKKDEREGREGGRGRGGLTTR